MRYLVLITLAACGARTELDTPANGEASDAAPDLLVPPSTSRQLALGNEHSCLRVGGAVWCWGENEHGELGDGTTVSRGTPARVVSLETATSVASGDAFDIAGNNVPPNMPLRGSHTCAVLADASLVCWGSNVEGAAVGPMPTLSPKPIAVSNALRVAVSGFESCALDSAQTVECWGDASEGELGDGSLGGPTPRGPVSVVALTNVVDIAAADEAACAARADGTVWCWGLDADIGELGDNQAVGSESAVPVQAIADHILHLAGGWGTVCALRDDGQALCWGGNDAGQTGNGSISNDVATPTLVALDGIEQIATSGGHACAVRSDHTLYCWGAGANGALGVPLPSSGIVSTPTKVKLDAVVEVAVGFHHTCARLADESVWCWGDNQSGQVGDGTLIDRDVPTRVIGLP